MPNTARLANAKNTKIKQASVSKTVFLGVGSWESREEAGSTFNFYKENMGDATPESRAIQGDKVPLRKEKAPSVHKALTEQKATSEGTQEERQDVNRQKEWGVSRNHLFS